MNERIILCIADMIGTPAEQITLESKLADDLDMDSLDIMETVIAIESEHAITIDDSEIVTCVTVADLVGVVKRTVEASV